MNNHYKPIAFIRELCKHKSEEEIQEAEYRFRKYLDLVRRISERLEKEGENLPDFDTHPPDKV